MKKIYTFLFTMALITYASAQDTAMDFTQDDCNGNSVHLFELLEQGHVVILEFFMDNCNPCINAGNAIEPVFVEQEAAHPGMVHWFHFGFNNTYTCDVVSGWVEEHGFPSVPFTNGASQVAYYGGFGMPTVVVVGGTDHDILFTAIGWSSGEEDDIDDAVSEFFGKNAVQDEAANATTTFSASYIAATQNIQIDLNMPTATKVEVEVYTAEGQLAFESERMDASAGESVHVISATKLTSGIYIITVRIGTQVQTQRISIVK
ncbi:MAG: T9SS type A sorting domain-containing protein [Flavobacteriales bacterium]